MRLLVVGDFHGKLPLNLKAIVKKEKIGLIISLGDYFPFSYRKIWFKHCYGKDLELWEVLGKKVVKTYMLKDLKVGENILKKLNDLGVPVLTVVGNTDLSRLNDQYRPGRSFNYKWKWESQEFFTPMIKKYKNIHRIDYSSFKFGNIIFIGAFGHSSPGHVKSRAYKKYKNKLENLFKKFRKENKEGKVIFTTHNVPFNTKLDKITAKHAHHRARGKHYGSKMFRRIIEKYQPSLSIGGHIHEGFGKDKIKSTLLVNPGAALEKRYAIIEIPEKKGKIDVKLLKKK
ncbi:Calcineurin-like phosphoesterase [uncultured archaeon]|nr:Calcineurin-like phosphoesterase [uncultured archaeon]